MHQHLTYETLEKLNICRPVDRIGFIANLCRDKRVLDVGCFDETALIKRDTEHWLHGRISARWPAMWSASTTQNRSGPKDWRPAATRSSSAATVSILPRIICAVVTSTWWRLASLSSTLNRRCSCFAT